MLDNVLNHKYLTKKRIMHITPSHCFNSAIILQIHIFIQLKHVKDKLYYLYFVEMCKAYDKS